MIAKNKDYYAILGVAPSATADEIKRAYRRLAQKFHPDLSRERDAEERFKEVSEAYETLANPERRAAYAQDRRHAQAESFESPSDWDREFGRVFGGSADDQIFSSRDRTWRPFHERPRGSTSVRGQDREVTVQLSLEEACHGTDIDLTASEGPSLGGTVDAIRRDRIHIPRGVVDGERLRISGKGGPGIGGGSAGDLYVSIAFRAHPKFKASGRDLYLDLPLAPWEATLGADVEIPTLEGDVRLTVPPATRAGQKLRLGGRGLPAPKGGTPGDLYCIVRIEVPTALTEQERTLYLALQRASTFNPRTHDRSR